MSAEGEGREREGKKARGDGVEGSEEGVSFCMHWSVQRLGKGPILMKRKSKLWVTCLFYTLVQYVKRNIY